MRLIWFLCFGFLVCASAHAQKVLTEGYMRYNISVTQGSDKPGVADAFAGASQIVYIKSYKARIDFTSPVRSQSIVYDAQSANGFVLNQSGQDKYMIPLEGEKWSQYNKKYKGLVFGPASGSKQIAGYNCKKALGKVTDGTEITVYYTSDLVVMAKGYDAMFASLDGMPLEYEITSNGVTINYSASSVQTGMVSAATFDAPKTGYKVLEIKQ